MPQLLPFEPTIGSYRVTTLLDTTPYIFDLHWNARANDGDGAWFMDILDEDEDPIRVGIKIVLGAWLGRRCVDPRFPPGVLVARDLSNEGREATFDDLGVRVVVYFYSGADILAL